MEKLRSLNERQYNIILVVLFVCLIGCLTMAYFESFIHNEIMRPAYLSIKVGCAEQSNSTQSMRDYAKSLGVTVAGVHNRKTGEIKVFVPDPDESVLKHELCHQKQHKEGYLYTCDQKFFKFLNEVECYIAQRR